MRSRSSTRAPQANGHQKERFGPPHHTRAVDGRALLGAGALAAGPFLELLQRHPEFWIAHDLGLGAALALALLLLLIPGGTVALATLALPAALRRPARSIGLGGLLALALLPPAVRALPDPVALAAGLAALFASLAVLAVARSARARRVASALIVAPALYALSFLASGLPGRLAAEATAPGFPPLPRPGAVVVAVFDELPLASLLAPDGRIDAARFPAFAALAADSTWFPDASASAGLTTLALPAILSGRHPDPSKLPFYADHPHNLFAWLGAQMPLRVQEPRTRLLPRRLAAAAGGSQAADARADSSAHGPQGFALLAADLALLYAHFALPPSLRAGLPPVDEDWLGFAAHGDAGADAHARGVAELAREARGRSKVAEFGSFVRSLEPCDGPCFVFVHCVLPHVPWEYTPEGRSVPTWAFTPGLSERDKRWGPEEAWVGEAWQRHLFQTRLVDSLLGSLVARLRRVGLYDRALLVVTADHGISLRPGVRERALSGRHPFLEDLLRVPLFVRAPGAARGFVDARPAASVDIAPTLADFLGTALPWPSDGISLLSASVSAQRGGAERSLDGPGGARPGTREFEAPAARPPRIAIALDGERIAVPADLALRRSAQDLVQRLLPLGGGVEGLYGRGPHASALLGRAARAAVAAAGFSPDPPRIELADAALAPPGRVPLRVIGRVVRGAAGAPQAEAYGSIAAAVGGRIRGVAPLAAGAQGALIFSVFLPDAVAARPIAELELYLVSGPPDAPRSTRAELQPGLALRELFPRPLRRDLAPVAE